MYAEFGAYIRRVRNDQKLSCERLSEGICSATMLTKIETEERFADKLLRDRLLERLGIDEYGFESFLPNKEYGRWQKREQIFRTVEKNSLEEAEQKIIEYTSGMEKGNCIEKQVYLCMQIQLQKKKNAPAEEILTLIKQALSISVPDFEKVLSRNFLLSYKEVDLYLEYVYYSPSVNRVEEYCELLDYIERSNWDLAVKAKIYPKICLYLCEYLLKRCKALGEIEKGIYLELLALCNRGINLLRETRRMYFLWELLCIRYRILEKMQEIGYPGEKLMHETLEWKQALLAVCQEAHSDITTSDAERLLSTLDSCYLYREKEVYSFSEVIKRRKDMLGLTWKQLSEGICSEKTMKRLCKEGIKTQPYIVRKLLTRVGLQAEYQRTDIVSESREIKGAAKKLKKCINEHKVESAEELLQYLKNNLSAKAVNRQFLLITEAILDEYKGNSVEEYIIKMKNALCCTLPYDVIESKDKKYFTNLELQCIFNIFLNLEEKEEKKKYVQMFLDIFHEYEKKGTEEYYISQYEWIMTCVGSILGSLGEYKKSTDLEKRIMQVSLSCHRMNMLYNNFYAIVWNEKESISKNSFNEIWRQKSCLQNCIVLSQLSLDTFYEGIFRKKLADIKGDDVSGKRFIGKSSSS